MFRMEFYLFIKKKKKEEGINLKVSAMSLIKPLARSPFISRETQNLSQCVFSEQDKSSSRIKDVTEQDLY